MVPGSAPSDARGLATLLVCLSKGSFVSGACQNVRVDNPSLKRGIVRSVTCWANYVRADDGGHRRTYVTLLMTEKFVETACLLGGSHMRGFVSQAL